MERMSYQKKSGYGRLLNNLHILQQIDLGKFTNAVFNLLIS